MAIKDNKINRRRFTSLIRFTAKSEVTKISKQGDDNDERR